MLMDQVLKPHLRYTRQDCLLVNIPGGCCLYTLSTRSNDTSSAVHT